MDVRKLLVWFAGAAFVLLLAIAGGAKAQTPAKTYRILHVMSYHTPWRWTEGQFNGFKEALGAAAEYEVFEMDTKRNSSKEWAEAKGKETRALIESFKPDLIYTTDDDAQEYVARHYVNSDIPIVFSGVNKHPRTYGFEGSRNVTGVLEHEHFVESVRLLKAIAPGIKRIAAVFDDAPMWDPVVRRMSERATQLPDVQIVAWDTIRTYDEYQRKIAEYQKSVDAIALIGIFNFKDASGKNVPYQDVLKWTAANSKLPDFGYWIDRVHFGTLAAMTVSEREQGLAAGRLARAILVDGKKPSELPMQPTVKGLPVISLARANALGIKLKSSLLLSSEVIDKFEWQKP
jgi:ABC-type uncharacterized transport system substrate-binding protein